MIKEIIEKLSVTIMVKYIDFVYYTSKVSLAGCTDIFMKDDEEKVIAVFWHGDSYCLYPSLKGTNLHIVTTKDRRGDYIEGVCKYFGYQTFRLPDESDGGNYLFKIRNMINKENSNLILSLDGPLGPYHSPKDIAFVFSMMSKRKVVPISLSVKRKIRLKKRWDNFIIPIPFNEIIIDFNDPIEINKDDKKEKFETQKENIKNIMEKYSD